MHCSAPQPSNAPEPLYELITRPGDDVDTGMNPAHSVQDTAMTKPSDDVDMVPYTDTAINPVYAAQDTPTTRPRRDDDVDIEAYTSVDHPDFTPEGNHTQAEIIVHTT